MAQIFNCPSCNRPLNVPDDLLGKMVKCPACGLTFATQGSAPPMAIPVEGGPVDEYIGEPAGRDGGWKQALTKLIAPAICLLVAGGLGLLLSLFSLAQNQLTPKEAMKQQWEQMIVNPQPENTQEQKEAKKKLREFVGSAVDFLKGPGGLAIQAVFVLLSLSMVLGAIAMLTGRMYWLALLGSIVAMININNCCCVLGLPFGIWSLIVLSQSDVKAAFK